MKVVGIRLNAEDQWGSTYQQSYYYDDLATEADRAHYRVWALGQFLNGIASNGNAIGDDERLTFYFRVPVFDSFTMSEIFESDLPEIQDDES